MSHQSHSQLAIHAPEADEGDLLKRRQIARRARIATVVVLVLLAAGAVRTVVSRMANARTLESGSEQGSLQFVRTTTVQAAGASQTLVLPGTLQGYVQAPIAARAGGYLRRWTKDIGSRVQQGELLAEIESPE